jgi:ParB/RepB/Spo0J family partition protein
MTKEKSTIIEVPIKNIKADPEQPRKNFDAAKLNILAKMIKEDGLLEPLKVKKLGEDEYMLIDGERRFRACKLIGLKDVPVIELNTMSSSERLIKQFHLQESKEDWTTAERSKAIHDLSKTLRDKKGEKLTHAALADLLGLNEKMIRTALAFGKVMNKEQLLRSEIGADLIPSLVMLNSYAKRNYQEAYEEEFTEQNQRTFERKIIELCQEGKITGLRDFAKIKDSINTKPETIKTILKEPTSKLTPDGLFLKSKAQSAYFLRNTVGGCQNATINARRWLKCPTVHPAKNDINKMKNAITELNKILSKYAKEMDIETE